MVITPLADYFERDARRKKLIENLRDIQRKNTNATIPIAAVLEMLERIEKPLLSRSKKNSYNHHNTLSLHSLGGA